jgi:predicted GH43/DUF377 family glycosyl hydrolase
MHVIQVSPKNLPKADYYLNSSIFRKDNRIFLAYRENKGYVAHLHICELNKDYQPIKNSDVPLFPPEVVGVGNYFEDPRVQYIDGKLTISYINTTSIFNSQSQAFSYLEDDFTLKDSIYFKYGFNINQSNADSTSRLTPEGAIIVQSPAARFEKNWVFFEYDHLPHFVYSIDDHIVVQPNMSTLAADKHYITSAKLCWKYGQPRGGTPPILIGDEYLCFFHSHLKTDGKFKVKCNRVYYFGAYTFSAKPPFEIKRMTVKPFAKGDPYDNVCLWYNAGCFPCGAIKEGGDWVISYGHNDHSMRIMVLPDKELQESLRKVKSVI